MLVRGPSPHFLCCHFRILQGCLGGKDLVILEPLMPTNSLVLNVCALCVCVCVLSELICATFIYTMDY